MKQVRTMKYRPITVNNIVGQDLAKRCILRMTKDIYESPRFILLAGEYGVGKLTLARNFVKTIHCPNQEKDYDCCGTCEVCQKVLSTNELYSEYNSEILERTEDILSLLKKDSKPSTIKVNVITECHKLSRQAQQRLYESTFNLPLNIFVIMITESTDMIIENLKMLSYVIRLNLLTDEQIKSSLVDIFTREGMTVEDSLLDLITRRSRGHLSDAYKMVDSYTSLDDESFKDTTMSARELYICYLTSCYMNNIDNINKYLSALKNIPLNYLKADYESLILEIMKVAAKAMKPKDKLMEVLMSYVKTKAIDLYQIMNDKIMYDSFVSDDRFQSAMYVIYLKLNNRLR